MYHGSVFLFQVINNQVFKSMLLLFHNNCHEFETKSRLTHISIILKYRLLLYTYKWYVYHTS